MFQNYLQLAQISTIRKQFGNLCARRFIFNNAAKLFLVVSWNSQWCLLKYMMTTYIWIVYSCEQCCCLCFFKYSRKTSLPALISLGCLCIRSINAYFVCFTSQSMCVCFSTSRAFVVWFSSYCCFLKFPHSLCVLKLWGTFSPVLSKGVTLLFFASFICLSLKTYIISYIIFHRITE